MIRRVFHGTMENRLFKIGVHARVKNAWHKWRG
jgi:hypothetical protein